MGEMDDIIREFLVESHENLDQLDRDFVALEGNPQDREKLSAIFRVIHTIKGTCGFLAFSKLEKVAHVGENLLSKLRDGLLSLSPEITDGLLAMVDAVRKMLSAIEGTGKDGEDNYAELIARLTALNEGKCTEKVPAVKPAEAEIKSETPVVTEPSSEAVAASPQTKIPEASSATAANSAVSDSSIRVDVVILDRLMNLVGELVLARNQILQFTGANEDKVMSAASQRLNLITTELQENIMKTRMQPIGNVWNKFPRVVRDLSHSLGKKVEIQMEGKETEIDKSLLEAIKDPLTHLVRNSVDHGIESPEIRRQRGKAEEGILTLRAYHEGGQVNIEIADDGGGIDAERIKKKAIEKGLLTSEQLARMGEREIMNLIFMPGFSTAEKVTNVSGRGVGMDVVKTNIEKISGMIDI